MTASAGKTLGLVLLILIIFLIAWPLKLLLFVPMGVFKGVFHGFRTPDFHWMHFGPFHFLGVAGLSLVALALLALWVAVAVWVYRDAERRGMNAVLWALLVFFGHFIGLLIFLIVRSDHPAAGQENRGQPAICPKCRKAVGQNHAYCPHCGERLQPVCPKCQKDVEKSWQACPHCGEKLG